MSSSAPGRVGSPSPKSNRRVRPAAVLRRGRATLSCATRACSALAAAIWPIQLRKSVPAGARPIGAAEPIGFDQREMFQEWQAISPSALASANFAEVVYATTQLGLPKSTMLNAIIIGSLIEVFTIPLFRVYQRYRRSPAALLCRRDLHDPVRLPAVLAFRHQECARHRRNGRRRHKLWPRPDVQAALSDSGPNIRPWPKFMATASVAPMTSAFLVSKSQNSGKANRIVKIAPAK